MTERKVVSVSSTEEMMKVVDGANTIFRGEDRKGDMGREFPALFHAKNLDNLRILKDEKNQVVSGTLMKYSSRRNILTK